MFQRKEEVSEKAVRNKILKRKKAHIFLPRLYISM